MACPTEDNDKLGTVRTVDKHERGMMEECVDREVAMIFYRTLEA